MPNELVRQSEQRRGLVGIEARRSVIVLDQYKKALAKTDTVTSDGSYSATGLTADFLELSDYSVQRLQGQGIEVPLIPIGAPEHSFHSQLRTAFDHRLAKPFPPYAQEYIDPTSHTRYVVSDKTERINERNREFVPGEDGFIGANSFFEIARHKRDSWKGTVVFDAYTGHPRYSDDSFKAWSAEINGTDELLCVEGIGAVLDVLTTIHASFPLDEVEIHHRAMFTERMDAVQASVEVVEREHSFIVKDAFSRLTRAIKLADFQNHFLSETPTRHKINGNTVYFYPTTAEFVTRNGESVSNQDYLKILRFALSYILASIPDENLPRDLFAE